MYEAWDMMELCGAQEAGRDGVCCGTWERCSSLLQARPSHGYHGVQCWGTPVLPWTEWALSEAV